MRYVIFWLAMATLWVGGSLVIAQVAVTVFSDFSMVISLAGGMVWGVLLATIGLWAYDQYVD